MVPRHMYQACGIGFNWPTNRPEFASVMIPNLNGTINPLHVQRTQTIDEAPFVVAFSIAGVDMDTGYVVNWVTANNATNISLYNASDSELKDNRQDGFIETTVSLPAGTIHIGDQYKACTMVLKDDSQICNTGFNSPTAKPEYNSVILP
jgi:hypothetical protein